MNDTVTVTAPKPRRRAGHRFGPHPVEIDRTTLTDAQWEALKSDPFLRVTVETVDAPAEAEGASPQTQGQDPAAAASGPPVKPAKQKKG